jgi:hypothetical protein
MDKLKATEFVELALEALRGLEDAARTGDRRTIDLKIEVLRQALFSVLEIIQAEKDDQKG